MSSSFNSGPKGQPTTTPIEKAVPPRNTPMVPGPAGSGQTIGGYVDARAPRAHKTGATAMDGAGTQAFQTDRDPTMSPPSPAPNGRDKGNRANPLAPGSMRMASKARGSSQGGSAAAASSTLTSLARGGGKVGGPGVGHPIRHQTGPVPAPAPAPASAPFQTAAPMARGGGNMTGQIQNGRGTKPGRSRIQ